MNKKLSYLMVLLMLCFGSVALCSCTYDDDSGDYTTYYQDDNDNGKLDKGEWNWTEDEDGNVVDVDDDLSNFE